MFPDRRAFDAKGEGTLSFAPRILEAEAIYILDVGAHPDAAAQLHAELERWDRFEIVADVMEADLVFAVDVVDEDASGSNGDGLPAHRAADTPSEPGTSAPVAEARAVMLVVDPETRAVLWEDSETFGLREHQTAAKVVGRLRERLAVALLERPGAEIARDRAPAVDAGSDRAAGSDDTGAARDAGSRGAGSGEAELAPDAGPLCDPGIVDDAGTVPTGAIPGRPELSEVMERGAEWTSRLGARVGYRWHAVVGNAGDSELPIEVDARLIDPDGNVLTTDTRSTMVPAGARTRVVGEGDVPERTARRATDWEIVARVSGVPGPAKPDQASPPATRRTQPLPTDGLDFDFGHAELEPPRLDGETVSRLMLPRGTAASVSCLVREDGTVATAMVREVGPRTLTTGQVGDIVQVLVSRAVGEWRFEPGRRLGERAAGWVTVEIVWD